MIWPRIFSAGTCLFLSIGQAQNAKPTFDVASIKINQSEDTNSSIAPRGTALRAKNVTLRTLVKYAYRPPNGALMDAQVIGGPDWINVDRFDIEAKADVPLPSGEGLRAMVRSLLEERFQLKVHRETRDLPVYNLVLTKKGPKLAADQSPPDQRQAVISISSQGSVLSELPRGALRMITGANTTTLVGIAVPIRTVVTLLQGQSDHMIIDKTGFDKLIDVHVDFRPDLTTRPGGIGGGSVELADTPSEMGLSLFTAIQDAGLKLESGKAPLDVLVVDGAQHPTEN